MLNCHLVWSSWPLHILTSLTYTAFIINWLYHLVRLSRLTLADLGVIKWLPTVSQLSNVQFIVTFCRYISTTLQGVIGLGIKRSSGLFVFVLPNFEFLNVSHNDIPGLVIFSLGSDWHTPPGILQSVPHTYVFRLTHVDTKLEHPMTIPTTFPPKWYVKRKSAATSK